MKKLETFLELTPTQVTPRLPVKQHGEVLEDLVTNWGEPYIQEIAKRYAHLPTTCAKPKPSIDDLIGSLWRRRRLGEGRARRRLETDHGLCIEGREQRNGFGGGI